MRPCVATTFLWHRRVWLRRIKRGAVDDSSTSWTRHTELFTQRWPHQGVTCVVLRCTGRALDGTGQLDEAEDLLPLCTVGRPTERQKVRIPIGGARKQLVIVTFR